LNQPEAVNLDGVWMPATETHLVDMMTRNPKGVRYIDGKPTYQYKKLEFAVGQCRQRRVALDIGGHVGLWSMWLVRMFEHVHAFEPVPFHRGLFERNVDMARCTLHACALGEHTGVIDIEVPDETTGNAHVAIGKRHPGTRHVANPDKQRVWRDVPLVTLDSFALERVDFIKIDVEGFERAVVQGGEQTIRSHRPVIVVEQKGNESAYGDQKDAAAKLLQSWGARPVKVLAGDWVFAWPGQ
jgi:FkbM family methyltransferase